MWVSRRKWRALEKKVANLESAILGQRLWTEVLHEFCRSVANKEGTCLLSYQQLYSPTADSSKKIRMLLKEIRKLS